MGKINLELGEEALALECFKRLLFLFPRDPELAELVENLELSVSPVMPEIEDDKGKRIDLKNWTQVNLKESMQIKKDDSTAIDLRNYLIKLETLKLYLKSLTILKLMVRIKNRYLSMK